MRVYLCGPIFNCTDEECKDWRKFMQEEYQLRRQRRQTFINAKFIDPMRRDYRGIESESYLDIVELDKVDVGLCDILVVSHSPDKASVGTSMETLYAWERSKYIIVVCPDAPLTPWLKYHSHKRVHTYKDAVTELIRVGKELNL
ncbi:hypothetical protein CL634_09405 [bacterium]|nr:hypothetical protein [bacterium]|tara:strand:- start:1270 stop:1701 length:432 start_codon:yes stop_codon:yes gene_type:complete